MSVYDPVRKEALYAVAKEFAQETLAILQTDLLDCARDIRATIELLDLVVQVDRKQCKNDLLDEMFSRIAPGIGWREYHQAMVAGSNDQYRHGLFLAVINQHEIDPNLIGRILLAILHSDLDAIRTLMPKKIASISPQVTKILLATLSKVFHPEIFAHLGEQLQFEETPGVLFDELAKAIAKSDLAMVTAIITVYGDKIGGCFGSGLGSYNLFLEAWNQCSEIVSLGYPIGYDPASVPWQIMRQVIDLLGTQRTWTTDAVSIHRWIYDSLSDPCASGPLLCLFHCELKTLIEDLRLVIMHRWAIKDELMILDLMTRFQIDREQLIAWYDTHEQYVATNRIHSMQKSCLPKSSLDVDWIISILSQKSAYSV